MTGLTKVHNSYFDIAIKKSSEFADSFCIFGESEAGKTMSIRTLSLQETYYIDADKKGLSWRGWREYYFSFLERKETKEL